MHLDITSGLEESRIEDLLFDQHVDGKRLADPFTEGGARLVAPRLCELAKQPVDALVIRLQKLERVWCVRPGGTAGIHAYQLRPEHAIRPGHGHERYSPQRGRPSRLARPAEVG